ncbi:glycoside hydrolase domain-containing protein [Neobacillus sp. LXY-4]|uniref:glycoside hydrolase domain-containing protein n=1 Tax=Neobacillus sp. LXY-4 TaxID=3379826 RepID=UPI003EE029A6
MSYFWGVDSAAMVNKELYDRVLNQFGKPSYWGRYIVTVPNAAEGLTRDEVRLIRNSGTKILPIYSNFTSAIGERQGRTVANNMIYQAKRLGIPKGKILFANVERHFSVDAAWITAFINTMFNSDYKAGIYFDPIERKFQQGYGEAIANNSNLANHVVLWSARPETGVSKARNTPRFRPSKPPCKSNVWGWQYGRDASECPIDTNLINQSLFELLW